MSKKTLVWVASTSILILVVNITALILWQSRFPDFPVFGGSIKQAKTVVENKSGNRGNPVIGEPTIPAYESLGELFQSLTLPVGWSAGEEGNQSSPIEESCPAKFDKVQPVLSKSVSLDRASDSVSGGVAQVFIYSAGLGARAFEDTRRQVKACGGNAWVSNSKSNLGAETLVVEDAHGNKMLSGTAGRTVYARFGDVVASVSIRGYGSNQADSILGTWVSQWEKTLIRSCPNMHSTLEDSNRSPLLSSYSGWLVSEKVELTQSQQSQAEVEGRQLALNASLAIPNSDSSIPSGPIEVKVKNSQYAYPDGFSSNNLASKPIEPGDIPVFPKHPLPVLVKGNQADPIGPGCGWAFTGEDKPVFDPNSLSSFDTDKLVATSQLLDDTRQWWLSKWQYGQDIAKYNALVDDWNSWIDAENLSISKFLWSAYDSQLLVYQGVLDKYNLDHQNWVNQCQGSESTTSTDPNMPTVDCTVEPTIPSAPKLPGVPRLS